MKPKSIRLFSATLIIATVATTSLSVAANGSWTNVANGDWSTGPWTGGVPNGSGETATFNQNWTGQTINVDGTYRVGSILATDTTAGGGLLLSGGTLILDNGINKPVIQTDAGFSEPGGSSPFNNPLRITSILDGSNGFEKTGPGYLSLEGANIFTGNVKLTAPASGGGSFLRLTNDNNLGDSGNDIEVVANALAVGLYASTGFTVTLNANRNIITSSTSGTQDFWVKTKGTGNIIINGVISGGTRFRKNDSGTATLSGANLYTGGTLIDAGTLILSGGHNRLPSTGSVTFGSGATLDVGATSQTVSSMAGSGSATVTGTYTVNGVGGKLLVNGDANFAVNGAVGTLVNMAGLSEFEYNRSGKNFTVIPTSTAGSPGTASTAELRLAANGIGKNTITAAAVTIGTATASGGADNLGTLRLGKENIINSGSIQIGGFNGRGVINFNTGLTTPTLKLRGVDGTSAMTSLNLGNTSSGTRSGAGVLDLTGGSLDAVVTNVVIGNNTTGIADNSALTMPAGTLTATTLKIGTMSQGTTVPTMTNALNQGGGTVTAATLTFGENTSPSGVPTFNASYNLAGGTLRAGTIQAGTGTFNSASQRRIGWTGGTIANYDTSTDLSINGVAGTGGSIILATSTATAKDFSVDANRKITLGANTSLTGSADLAKNGDGMLLLNGTTSSYTGTLSVDDGTLGGATSLGGNVTVGAGGKLAPGASTGAIGTIATKGATWTAGSIWEFDLSAGTPGSSDLLSIDGDFTKAGSGTYQFNFMNSSPTVWGAVYTLVTWTGTTGFSLGDFSYTNLGGAYDGQAGTGFTLNANSLTFTAVPEPTSALAGLLLTVGLLRRRRH
jgi:autotransporter-associated beta strand protein